MEEVAVDCEPEKPVSISANISSCGATLDIDAKKAAKECHLVTMAAPAPVKKFYGYWVTTKKVPLYTSSKMTKVRRTLPQTPYLHKPLLFLTREWV